MLLCLNVGNSHIYGGVFQDEEILLKFRQTAKVSTSDEIGIFLKNVLRENHLDPTAIKQIALYSVVPQLNYSLRSACMKYFATEPFLLQAGVKAGLNIKYRREKRSISIASISLPTKDSSSRKFLTNPQKPPHDFPLTAIKRSYCILSELNKHLSYRCNGLMTCPGL